MSTCKRGKLAMTERDPAMNIAVSLTRDECRRKWPSRMIMLTMSSSGWLVGMIMILFLEHTSFRYYTVFCVDAVLQTGVDGWSGHIHMNARHWQKRQKKGLLHVIFLCWPAFEHEKVQRYFSRGWTWNCYRWLSRVGHLVGVTGNGRALLSKNKKKKKKKKGNK